MNINDFTLKRSTVAAVYATDHGTEIWGAYDDGTEAAYAVNDSSFRAREGHVLTAVLFGRQPVALRNDTTRTKIQLLTGEDILGSGPQVQSRSIKFWLFWLFLIMGPGLLVAAVPQVITLFFPHSEFVKWLAGALGFLCYLALVFGTPYWFIIHPRILRSKHQRRIKAADKSIAEIFNPL